MTDVSPDPQRGPDVRDAVFATHRGLVFQVAYDILGSIVDAEDVCQDTYLRWIAAPTEPANPRAYLARTAANVALNWLRASSRRREEYVGPWLPDPLPTAPDALGPAADDPEQAALMAEAVSAAMLVVLQNLGERERAAFILRDVFDVGYDDIAEALASTPAGARQLVHRARERVHSRKDLLSVTAAEHRAVVGSFVAATQQGDLEALLQLLSPNVVAVTDSGGLVSAARRPVVGADNVMRFLLGLLHKNEGATFGLRDYNGRLAVDIRLDDALIAIFQFVAADGHLAEVRILRHPDRLARIDRLSAR